MTGGYVGFVSAWERRLWAQSVDTPRATLTKGDFFFFYFSSLQGLQVLPRSLTELTEPTGVGHA